MDLEQFFIRLNFLYNKFTGSFYTVSELENEVDAAQMSVYSDFKPKYATSQLAKEILQPFWAQYNFTTGGDGIITVPAATPPIQDYLDLLHIQTYSTIAGRVIYHGVKLYNEDELPDRLNSQISPVTTSKPIGEQIGVRKFQLTPAAVYTGNLTYLKRPIRPVYGHTVVGGRKIVYDPNTSTQLQWRQSELNLIIIKALKAIGENLTSAEVAGWAEQQSQANYQNVNRI